MLEALPHELLFKILLNLSPGELSKIARLNTRFNLLVKDKELWKAKFLKLKQEVLASKMADAYKHYLGAIDFQSYFQAVLASVEFIKNQEASYQILETCHPKLKFWDMMFDKDEAYYKALRKKAEAYQNIYQLNKAMDVINSLIKHKLEHDVTNWHENFEKELIADYILRGKLYAQLNKHTQALCDFKQVEKIWFWDPIKAEAFELSGDSYFAQQKYDEAIDYYKAALKQLSFLANKNFDLGKEEVDSIDSKINIAMRKKLKQGLLPQKFSLFGHPIKKIFNENARAELFLYKLK